MRTFLNSPISLNKCVIWLTSDRQSRASCDELQEESLLLGIEAAQHLKQEPNCTAAE